MRIQHINAFVHVNVCALIHTGPGILQAQPTLSHQEIFSEGKTRPSVGAASTTSLYYRSLDLKFTYVPGW